MYVGPGVPDKLGDIMLRDIKLHQKQSTITTCTVVTGQRMVATYIDGILTNRGLVNVFPVEPKFPLFDNVRNPKTRALIGIALGCDVLPGGVPGVGASSLNNLLGTVDLEADGAPVDLATKLSAVKKAQLKDAHALLCIANLLVYERTTSELGYMFETPAILEKYNEAFASPVTQLVDGPTVLECKGCVGQCHSFLEAEGDTTTCSVCKATLCRFCIWSSSRGDDDNSGAMCFECKRYSIAGVEYTIRHMTAISNNEHVLAHQQIVEMIDVEHGTQQLSQINPAVLAASGLEVHTSSWYNDRNCDGDTHHDDDS